MNYRDDLDHTQFIKSVNGVEKQWSINNLRKAVKVSARSLKAKDENKTLQIFENTVNKIRSNGKVNSVIEYDISEFAPKALERYSTAFEEEEIIKTGIHELDEKMGGGFRKPNLVGLGSGTQSGKSIVSMNFGYNAFTQGLSVAYVSLEMSEEEFLARLHSRISKVNATKILMRQMNNSEILTLRESILIASVEPEKQEYAKNLIKSFGKNLVKFKESDFNTNFYNDKGITLRKNTYYPIDIPSNCNIKDLRVKILKLQQTRSCDMLIIDYPGIMSEISESDQNWGTYSSLYTRLKALARELNVVLLAPIQSYDDGEYKYSKSIRDHIDIGLNWKRTEEDLKQSRVRFWFTKLRHSKIEIYEGDKDAIEDKTDEDIDYSMRNPVFAKLDTDVMLLDTMKIVILILIK